MTLPTFLPARRSRKAPQEKPTASTSPSSGATFNHHLSHPSSSTVRAATRTRLIFSLLTSLLFLIALVFLILVEVGNTHAHRAVVGNIYFLKLDLSHIIPQAVPHATLINSIARTLGLHDFYQVGLWNYCEGYGNKITDCSKPQTLYWFNPVEIILSQLLAGATVALPANIVSALTLVRTASHWMFALFLTGACTCFISIFLTPLSIYTRWATLPIAIFAFLTALTTTAASIIATAMFIIFRNVIHGAESTVNIVPQIGIKMFAFMWVASGTAIVGWLIQLGLCCCCASRRDVRLGKKTGRAKAWRQSGEIPPHEMRQKDGGGIFRRRK
ncbi:SUR7/PalI family-domain-containing protein [Usnea florida]